MIKRVKDYVEEVLKEFPFLTLNEINRIISFGLRRYAKANKLHADVLLSDPVTNNYFAFTGTLGFNVLNHFRRFCNKWRMKERVLFLFNRKKWDGYYYIGLTQEQHDKIKNRKNITFENVYACKIKQECYHLKWVKLIWRIPATIDMGWKYYIDKLITNKAEYVEPNKYESYHLCFLGRYDNGLTSVSDPTDSID